MIVTQTYPGKHRRNMPAINGTVVPSTHQPRHRREVFVVEWKAKTGKAQQVLTEGEANAARIATQIAHDVATTDVVYYSAPEVVS